PGPSDADRSSSRPRRDDVDPLPLTEETGWLTDLRHAQQTGGTLGPRDAPPEPAGRRSRFRVPSPRHDSDEPPPPPRPRPPPTPRPPVPPSPGPPAATPTSGGAHSAAPPSPAGREPGPPGREPGPPGREPGLPPSGGIAGAASRFAGGLRG